jgi:hypothetical protein
MRESPTTQPARERPAERARALEGALGPIAAPLEDLRAVEFAGDADGVVWVNGLGDGLASGGPRVRESFR